MLIKTLPIKLILHLMVVSLMCGFWACIPTHGARNVSSANPNKTKDASQGQSQLAQPDVSASVRVRPERSPLEKKVLLVEQEASAAGRKILAAARTMIEKDVVVIGSCWDYANAVYNRAGFKNWRTRKTIFRGRKKGPYADPKLVKAGDWLYLINHLESLATHSVIFVFWKDIKLRQAVVITYVGNRREESGYYRTYDVSRIYRIKRPKLKKRPEGRH